MKRLPKIIRYLIYSVGSVIAVGVLIFAILFVYFYFVTPQKQADKIVNQKIGLSAITNTEQISDKIAPLSYDLITNQYPILSGKKIANFIVSNPEQYSVVVEKKHTEMKSEIQKDIANANDVIVSIDELIAKNDNLLKTQDLDYQNNCVTQIKYNNCPELLQIKQQNINDIPKIKAEAVAAKARWVDYIAQSKYNLETSEKMPVDTSSQGGITFCPGTIYIKFDSNMSEPALYLMHAIHESFHALSCSPKGNILPSMWEEGFTDYFATKVFTKYLGFETDYFVAFPYEVKLLRHLAEFIPEDQLLNIYISKDEAQLKQQINKKLGSGTYDRIVLDMNKVFYKASYSNGFTSNSDIDSTFNDVNSVFINK